jgi:hypothetical protein
MACSSHWSVIIAISVKRYESGLCFGKSSVAPDTGGDQNAPVCQDSRLIPTECENLPKRSRGRNLSLNGRHKGPTESTSVTFLPPEGKMPALASLPV